MKRAGFALMMVLGVMVTHPVTARQGIYEYWKAGTKRSHTRATLPRGRRTPARTATRTPAGLAHSATRSAAPWTAPWFADSALVHRHIGTMAQAIVVSMIGETYPLPRGGAFNCTPMGGDASATGGPACRLECAGADLGGRRWNEFYGAEGDPALVLERVRWLIVAPRPREDVKAVSMRSVLSALADSVSAVMGPTRWSSDGMVATWHWQARTTTVRLHDPTRAADSLEVECASDRITVAAK